MVVQTSTETPGGATRPPFIPHGGWHRRDHGRCASFPVTCAGGMLKKKSSMACHSHHRAPSFPRINGRWLVLSPILCSKRCSSCVPRRGLCQGFLRLPRHSPLWLFVRPSIGHGCLPGADLADATDLTRSAIDPSGRGSHREVRPLTLHSSHVDPSRNVISVLEGRRDQMSGLGVTGLDSSLSLCDSVCECECVRVCVCVCVRSPFRQLAEVRGGLKA